MSDVSRWGRPVIDACAELERAINPKNHDNRHESKVHEVFANSPFLLPYVFDMHHGPLGGVVLSKPRLGPDFIPDFALVTCNSAFARVVLIEIEDPCKRIFTKSDAFDHEFNAAMQQVRDWLIQEDVWWPTLLQLLGEHLNPNYHPRRYDWHKTSATLIYGRRSEITTRKRQERWSSVSSGIWVDAMTYDRILGASDFAERLGTTVAAMPFAIGTWVYRDRGLEPYPKIKPDANSVMKEQTK
jgi:hypothetical protein